MSYLCVALSLLLWVVTSSARADQLFSTLEQPLREISHAVEVSIAEGIATYKVRRVFANDGLVADEAGLTIDLPYGAAATGLRIRARNRWYDAELMEAERAAERYRELTGLGAFAPKDPALLQWLWADQLHLQVFPVLPGASSTVEYTLTVPTRYARGRVLLSYPRGWPAEPSVEEMRDELAAGPTLTAPVVTLKPSWGDATTPVFIDGQRAASDTPLVLASQQPISPWAPKGEADGVRYVGSTITVERAERTLHTFANAQLHVDVEHTYRSDLKVELITPAGDRLLVFDQGQEGGENDLRGTYDVTLPRATSAAGQWHLIVSDHVSLDAGTLTRWSLRLGSGTDALRFLSQDTPLFIPDAPDGDDDPGLATLDLLAPKIDILSARFGRVVASAQHAFVRLEIDVAAQLMPLPKKAQLVFVLDASHSQGQQGIDAQLEMIVAYLSHVPDAEVEVVMYRRFAERLFDRFVSAPTFEESVAQARTKGLTLPGNGSNLDAGARLAGKLLQKRTGPLRVVITSDTLLRPSFHTGEALDALKTLPRRAVVHVVRPGAGDPDWANLEYDSQHALAPIAAAHHGVFATLTAAADGRDKALRHEILALVRPTQICDFRVLELDDPLAGTDGVLREGEGIRLMGGMQSAPNKLTILGKIWGDPFRRAMYAKARFSKATAGWVFGEDEHHDLSDDEMMRVARMGAAVSPVTSYLAVEPGVRPSTVGLPVGHGFETSGYGRGSGGFREGSARAPIALPDLKQLAQPAVQRCFAQHAPPAAASLLLRVDTTRSEIVDVIAPVGDRSALTKCLVEALWALDLTAYVLHERDHFQLQLSAP